MLMIFVLLLVLVVLWLVVFSSSNYELNMLVGAVIVFLQLYLYLELYRLLRNKLNY